MTFEHGTAGGYTNHKCRCDLCKRANSDLCKKYRENNAQKISTQRSERRVNNPEEVRAVARNYYANNIDKIRESDRKRYRENPDRKYSMWLKNIKYRGIGENVAHGCITKNSIDELIALNNNSCVYCGGPYEQIDHIIPWALGGTGCIENLTTACAKCNASKGTKLLENWLPGTIEIKTLKCVLGE